jgi:hypothetical protein
MKLKTITMVRNPVNSSNIKNIGYEGDSKILEIEFHGRGAKKGPIWRYFPITLETYKELLSAESVGFYFHHHIKNNDMVSKERISDGSN